MARTWPTIDQFQNMLYGAGILNASPPTGQQSDAFIDYQAALDGAREDFERDVRIKPFLADGSEAQEQYIQFSGSPTGGTVKISYAGATSAVVAPTATAAAVQTALQGISTIGSGKATVTGDAGGPYSVALDSNLAPYSWLTLDTNSLTGGSSPSLTVDEMPQYEVGPRGYSMQLEDIWFSIRQFYTDRFQGSAGALRTYHTDYEFEYFRQTKGIERLRFNAFIGGNMYVGVDSPNFIQIIGRRGVTDDLPANVFNAVLAKAANHPMILPVISAQKSGGRSEWREGDVSEKYGSSSGAASTIYGAQAAAWEQIYSGEVDKWTRMRLAAG